MKPLIGGRHIGPPRMEGDGIGTLAGCDMVGKIVESLWNVWPRQ
jgi:hypothetical protein